MATFPIAEGIVLDLDVDCLNRDNGVQKPNFPTDRSGPFLCYCVVGEKSCWAPLTTQHRDERLELKLEWRRCNAAKSTWLTRRQFLNDGRTVYCGLSSVFCKAASVDKISNGLLRCVTSDGIAAVRVEIERRRGRFC